MKSVLVTGFEPFLGDTRNPSQEIVAAIVKEGLLGVELQTLVLPVSFARAWSVLNQKINEFDFDFLLMLGLAKGRRQICLERVALNWVESRVPDEDGQQPLMKQIQKEAPAAWINPLPLEQWSQDLRHLGHRVELSWSAGAFVCNSIYFQAAMKMGQDTSKSGAGQLSPRGCLFVHVPWVDEMPMDEQVAALRELIQLIKAHRAAAI